MNITELSIESSKKYRDEFSSCIRDMVFEDRGILNSEMLLVCSMVLEQKIDVLIESGRFLGQSTEVLARFFSGKPLVIESIEIFRDKNAQYVEEKLRKYGNVILLYGDAQSLVPNLVRKHRGKNIAILFDGPKGLEAIRVFQKAIIVGRSDVKLGFFHDMRKSTPEMPTNSRDLFEHHFPHQFCTDDKEFVHSFEDLDVECQNHEWSPHKIAGKPIGSYGPTMGMVMPSQIDIENAKKSFLQINLNVLRNALQSKFVVFLKRLRGEIT